MNSALPQRAFGANPDEVARFDRLAATWWDPDGESRPLHDLNPARLAYITERLAQARKQLREVEWRIEELDARMADLQADLGRSQQGGEVRLRDVLVDVAPRGGGPLTVELWLVAHRELRTSRRIRRVFDFLATEVFVEKRAGTPEHLRIADAAAVIRVT